MKFFILCSILQSMISKSLQRPYWYWKSDSKVTNYMQYTSWSPRTITFKDKKLKRKADVGWTSFKGEKVRLEQWRAQLTILGQTSWSICCNTHQSKRFEGIRCINALNVCMYVHLLSLLTIGACPSYGKKVRGIFGPEKSLGVKLDIETSISSMLEMVDALDVFWSLHEPRQFVFSSHLE